MSEYASTSEESNSNEFERSYKYNTETAAINIKNNKAIWRFSLEDNRIVKISRDRRVAPNEIAIIPKFQQKMVRKTMKRNHIQYCSKIENCMNWKWCTKKKWINRKVYPADYEDTKFVKNATIKILIQNYATETSALKNK